MIEVFGIEFLINIAKWGIYVFSYLAEQTFYKTPYRCVQFQSFYTRNMRNTLLAILLIISVGCNATKKKEFSYGDALKTIISEFENQLKKDLEDDNINTSISGAIVKGNEIIWSSAFGLSDIDSKAQANTATIYRTGSISKSFTSFLMMQLVQEGTIELYEPIEKYLPEISKLNGYSDSTKITFQQLASHRSGLIREPNLENAASGPIEEWENKILLSIPKTSFQSKPGDRYSYSNIGFGILGLALSRAADKSFIEMVKGKIFKPLYMNSSFHCT